VEASGGDTSTKRTIHVTTAGTLPNLISDAEKYTIEELTLTGELNGTDFRLLRDMAGNNYLGQNTDGKLKVLDMSEARIVAGGEKYLDTDNLIEQKGRFRYMIEKADELPQHVFHGCKLTEVNMPNSLNSIANHTFAFCSELSSVTIPSTVNSIGSSVFWDCKSLVSATIPSSVSFLGDCSFYGCSSLTSITIPNNVTSIESATFQGCSGMTSIIIPNSVTSIGESSFRDCSSLNSISIPNSVTSIGDFSFYGCSGLTSITIPSNVSSIGVLAFYGCVSLVSIKVENKNTTYDSRNDCNAIIETSTNTIILGCKNTLIPNNVISIGRYAFRGCTGLTSIIIPRSVTSIEDYAFRDCSSLSSISIPNSMSSIGQGAFSGCSSLTSITLPNGVTNIGSSAFYRCSNLTSVISEIVNPFEIEELVFWSISPNATLTVPSGTKSKYQSTNYWNKFTNIVEASGDDTSTKRTIHVATAGTLPNLISESEKYTIEELTLTGELNGTDFRLLRDMAGNNYLGQNTDGKLNVLDLSGTRIVAGGEKYLDTDEVAGISYVGTYHHEILQNNEIPKWVFFACNLNKIVLPNSIKAIGFESFGFCRKLASIIMPNSLMSIGYYSFHNCRALTSITIPNSVTYIDDYAFCGCAGLSSLTIPNSVTGIASSAFNDCSGLTSIKVEDGNAIYDSRNGCNAIIETSIIDSSWSTLVLGCKNTVIPNTVTSIGDYAFYGCSGLTSITIPNSVKKIYSNAFRGCSGLTSLIIPNSVVSIESHAFEDCSSLSSITIPNSLTSIGLSVFSGCGGLTSIISEIVDPFEISDDVFSDYTKATLTVPSGTKSKYQATNYWNKFTNIVEASGGSTATEVTFTSNQITYKGTVSSKTAEVKSVDTGVANLEVPSSVSYDGTTYQVTSIADDALSNRTFNYVSLPSTVKTVSSSTFYNSRLGALIWKASASLSSSVFSNMAMPVSSNFLLYVNSTSYAPSNVKNVVINSSAQTILLSDDGGDFYCPKAFTAQSISYTHNYSMTTGGSGKGWETLALPFDVQKIEHSTKGILTPFALYDTNSTSQRPFWLYELGSNGFRRSEGIKANTPYIISMPNNTSYDSEYVLTGDVTFSATSVQVRVTSSVTTAISGSKRFVPAFSTVAKGSSVYALNVSNQKVSNSSSYDSGSRFISNLRSVYPFEAYMTTSSSGARMLNIGIEFEDDATDIDIIPSANGEQGVVKVYSLNGTLVLQTDRESLQKQWEPLPAGIYIVNGKKMVK